MRIRRRPQPSPQQTSDPATSASPSRTLRNAATNRDCFEGDEGEGRLDLEGQKQKSGVARRLVALMPSQDNALDSDGSVGAGKGAGDVVVHMRCSVAENGRHGGGYQKDDDGRNPDDPATTKVEEEHASDVGALLSVPVVPAAVVTVKREGDEVRNGGVGGGGVTSGCKKRRGAAVQVGSRCSRVNGRGWRCSQPTLVGYSLCEHHLGKGRPRSGSGSTGQLGRTEHRARVLPTSSAAGAQHRGATTRPGPCPASS